MKAPKLTAWQRRRVREMVEDEGSTRRAAVAWVTTFEPGPKVAVESEDTPHFASCDPERCECGS